MTAIRLGSTCGCAANVARLRYKSRIMSNSTDELEKLIAELERLQEFLKSETGRVQREIGSVLDGIGIIIEAIAPWKTAGIAGTPNPR
jgi:hypothetical protein